MIPTSINGKKLADCNILIVDDQESSRLVLKTLLQDIAHCDAVSSGHDAIAFCKEHTPDLIIMDVMMPDLDGHQTSRLLHDSERNCPPIMFVTSSNSDEEQSKCWDSGCVDFVTKPISACTLTNRVRSQLINKLKSEALESLIYVDKLTNAYNRHYLDDYLPKLFKDASRNHLPFSIIMVDIDNFKPFNDTYGHLKGDECLKAVCHNMNEGLLRPFDKLIRMGGEEFLVVLPNTDEKGAAIVAERILNGVFNLDIEHKHSEHHRVTVSAGVCTKPIAEKVEIDQMLLEADKYLYEAKTAGRNCFFPNANKHHNMHSKVKALSRSM